MDDDSLFYFDSESPTIVYGDGFYRISYNGVEREEVFPSMHEAARFLDMLIFNEIE
jgi:hypothetical protein